MTDELKDCPIKAVYKKYVVDNSKKTSIYNWEFRAVTPEFISDMWEAIKEFNTRHATPQLQPIELKEAKKVVKEVLKASCTCNDGHGIVCVGCFYNEDIAKAIVAKFGSALRPLSKEHFEANMLDGDKVDDCGKAMLSAKEVWDYLKELSTPKVEVKWPEKKLIVPEHDCGGESDCWWCKIQEANDNAIDLCIAAWKESVNG